jgi:hypothetical protein
MRSRLLLGGRVVAAVLVLIGGYLHLKLYFDSYRHTDVGGPFLLNAAASLVVAAALVLWRSVWVPVAGLVLVNATLISFGLSRTSTGVFGFTENGFQPSPEAAISLVVEIAAAAVLVALLYLELHEPAPASAPRPALG